MSDDRERNQGMKQGTGEGTGQHAPGRNPQDDRSAGRKQDEEKEDRQGGQFDPSEGGDGVGYKEGGQNEETRRQKVVLPTPRLTRDVSARECHS